MPTATLTSKGQTTVPQSIREHLHLKPGDRIDFVIQDDGLVVLRPATRDAMEFFGVLRRPGSKPVSVDQMKAAIRGRFAGR